MPRYHLPAIAGRSIVIAVLFVLVGADPVAGQNADPLRVRAEADPGPFFVGQGFELRVGVIAGAQRPKVDTPKIAGARAWPIGTELRPITATGIGSVVTQQNRFVFRFRVLPTRSGTLEIPAIHAQQKDRSGRSQRISRSVQPVPLQGRPANFLGGVGAFETHAEAAPSQVRVGQEFDFRIKVTGPGAWGMTGRPDLGRFERLSIGLRIELRPDETVDEPPARTIVYRLRPTQPGEVVLPPVSISAYDPSLSHYVTQATAGVSIRVVAVAPFDPATVKYDPPATGPDWPARAAWIFATLAIVIVGAYVLSRRKRAELDRPFEISPERARRFAWKTARHLGSHSGMGDPWIRSPEAAAREISESLATYLRLGTGQSLTVLTPDEARQGVEQLTSSSELGAAAGELTGRCDRILYRDADDAEEQGLSKLADDARRLFEALGRVKRMRGLLP